MCSVLLICVRFEYTYTDNVLCILTQGSAHTSLFQITKQHAPRRAPRSPSAVRAQPIVAQAFRFRTASPPAYIVNVSELIALLRNVQVLSPSQNSLLRRQELGTSTVLPLLLGYPL